MTAIGPAASQRNERQRIFFFQSKHLAAYNQMVDREMMVKTLLAFPLAALLLSAFPYGVQGAESVAVAGARPARPPSPAQLAARERMRDCAATARGQQLAGDPRKAFMKTCLAKR
ncbi:hypothetical protein F0Q34_07250 [Pseudoroseomonas oryzae]|uniref:Phosphate starvation-inducible protein PsiF n=2 Tax=Teichococcus oryzae TaxID=1608942 RepID=A0A5B2TIA5_9PROT|nr:hypothetical protein F0Q34_07250 [Pseudoroseomonas oryzae]